MELKKYGKREQRLQVRKEREKGSNCSSQSYENRQPMEAQTETKIKHRSVLPIFMHKHVDLKILI